MDFHPFSIFGIKDPTQWLKGHLFNDVHNSSVYSESSLSLDSSMSVALKEILEEERQQKRKQRKQQDEGPDDHYSRIERYVDKQPVDSEWVTLDLEKDESLMGVAAYVEMPVQALILMNDARFTKALKPRSKLKKGTDVLLPVLYDARKRKAAEYQVTGAVAKKLKL